MLGQLAKIFTDWKKKADDAFVGPHKVMDNLKILNRNALGELMLEKQHAPGSKFQVRNIDFMSKLANLPPEFLYLHDAVFPEGEQFVNYDWTNGNPDLYSPGEDYRNSGPKWLEHKSHWWDEDQIAHLRGCNNRVEQYLKDVQKYEDENIDEN